MKYIEYHKEWKEYEKKKEWMKAIELLQDEMAYNILLAHNKYSDVKYDENSIVDRDVVYIWWYFAHNSKGEIVKELEELDDFMVCDYGSWRTEYELCLINEDGLYDERDQRECLENTKKQKRKLIRILKRL